MSKIIDIVGPASNCSHDELMAAIEWLEKEGFTPRIGKDIIKPHLFFASELKTQLNHLKKALAAKDSDFIWCLRGGYGSMRLIPELNKLAKPKKEKIFLGFSDITSLHIFFTQKWNWTTYHGPNFSSMYKKDPLAQDTKEVMHLVHGEKYKPKFEDLIPLNKAALKKSVITSKVTGGNLRMVQSGIKTLHEIKTKNKILFFEDVGERGYSIDRMLEQMIQSGHFKDVKAVIFGDFSEGLEKDGTDKKMDALKSFAQKMNMPVLCGLHSGHEKLNRVLPFNQKCQLLTGKSASLVF